MTTRKLFLAAAGAALLTVGGAAPAQYIPPGFPTQKSPPLPGIVAPIPATPGNAAPSVPGPADMTIDQLLDAVEALRAEKAALVLKEQALLKAIGVKVEKQRERLNKVGAGAPLNPGLPD